GIGQKVSTTIQKPCPATTSELGNSTWTFLHSVAAYYPKNPSAEHKQAAKDLLNALLKLYPCVECREDANV
ncbi:MAG: hypothetical protein MHPSP_003415, partial [Paramarteilia canceri]